MSQIKYLDLDALKTYDAIVNDKLKKVINVTITTPLEPLDTLYPYCDITIDPIANLTCTVCPFLQYFNELTGGDFFAFCDKQEPKKGITFYMLYQYLYTYRKVNFFIRSLTQNGSSAYTKGKSTTYPNPNNTEICSARYAFDWTNNILGDNISVPNGSGISGDYLQPGKLILYYNQSDGNEYRIECTDREMFDPILNNSIKNEENAITIKLGDQTQTIDLREIYNYIDDSITSLPSISYSSAGDSENWTTIGTLHIGENRQYYLKAPVAGSTVTGNYLPISGGTMSGSIDFSVVYADIDLPIIRAFTENLDGTNSENLIELKVKNQLLDQSSFTGDASASLILKRMEGGALKSKDTISLDPESGIEASVFKASEEVSTNQNNNVLATTKFVKDNLQSYIPTSQKETLPYILGWSNNDDVITVQALSGSITDIINDSTDFSYIPTTNAVIDYIDARVATDAEIDELFNTLIIW